MKTRKLILGSMVLAAATAFADEAPDKRKDRKDPGPSFNDRVELEVLFKLRDWITARIAEFDDPPAPCGVHQPCATIFLGTGNSAAIKNAGQYTAWKRMISLPTT